MEAMREALQRAAKRKGLTRNDLFIEEGEPLANVAENFGLLGMGSVNNVSSMLTPEAQALREVIRKRNRIEKAGEPQGKVIEVQGGDLNDIRDAQLDFNKQENKVLSREASDMLWSIKDELKNIEDSGKSLTPEQIDSYKKRIDEYYKHPKSVQDIYARNLMRESFNESLRRLDPRNYTKAEIKNKSANVIPFKRPE